MPNPATVQAQGPSIISPSFPNLTQSLGPPISITGTELNFYQLFLVLQLSHQQILSTIQVHLFRNLIQDQFQ